MVKLFIYGVPDVGLGGTCVHGPSSTRDHKRVDDFRSRTRPTPLALPWGLRPSEITYF